MIIGQMLWGGNGYYLFDKPFFEGIAAANDYKILFSAYNIITGTMTKNGSSNQFFIPMNRELLNTIDFGKVFGIGVYSVLQKKVDAVFQFPYQHHYLAKQQGHLGFNRLFIQDPPAYSYIPVFDTGGQRQSSKELFKTLVGRILVDKLKTIKRLFEV